MGWEDAPLVTATPAKQSWESAPLVTPPTNQPHVADSLAEDAQAGWQGSATGLITRGKLPDVVLDPHHAKWYDKLITGATQMGAEAPLMIAGALGGGAAGAAGGGAVGSAVPVVGTVAGAATGAVVGAGAGGFAVPTAIRESLTQYYDSQEGGSSADFLTRAGIVIKATGKDALIGGLTGGLGKYAQVGAAARYGERVGSMAGTATTLGTLTVAPAALEGRLPEPSDFVNTAILMVGFHGATKGAAKLREIYAKTGIPPEQVLADSKVEPSIGEDLAREPVIDSLNHDPHLTVDAINRATELIGGDALQKRIINSLDKLPEGERTSNIASITEAEARLVVYYYGINGEVGSKAWNDIQVAKERQLRTPTENTLPEVYKPIAARLAAEDAVPNEKAQSIIDHPFADIPEAKLPTQLNLKTVEGPDSMKATLTKMSEVYQAEIENQRGGTQGWAETETKKQEMLKDLMGPDVQKIVTGREPGTAANAVELSVRGDMLMQATMDMSSKLDILEKAKSTGTDTAQMKMDALEAIHRAGMIQAEFTGAAAEAGRALQYLQKIKEYRNYGDAIQKLTQDYGGDPDALLKGMTELKNDPVKLAKGAKKFAEATTYEKLVEAWKSGLVSNLITHVANIMGNMTFMAVRPVVDAVASTMGALRMNPERTTYTETLARTIGNIHGTMEGLADAMHVIKEGTRIDAKADTHKRAIGGTLGETVRLPFRFLSAEDAVFRIMNERGEAYAIGTRQALSENLNPLTSEFRTRVAEVANNPSELQQKQIDEAGLRMTFNSTVGAKGRSIQQMVNEWKLQMFVPFVQTPINVFKEMTRLTPFAPIIGEWRNDFNAGGARADKAIAEMTIGSATMGVTMMQALNGNISGAGNPDPAKKRVDLAAGWQPYSIKINNKWYNYQRLQPIGTLLGLSADMADVWHHMSAEENDKVAKILATAFSNAVSSQTFLQGITNVTNALSDPTRFGPRLVQGLAASTVPGIVGQTAQWLDPYVREINSIGDAVKNRIPGMRTSLYAARDPFGEFIEGKDRIGGITPIAVRGPSDDKVRTEASRLHIGVAKAPNSIELPALGNRELGKVALSPEKQDLFAATEGKLAYEQLNRIVNSRFWDEKSDTLKRIYYDKVFQIARSVATKTVLSTDERQQEMTRIVDNLHLQLNQ